MRLRIELDVKNLTLPYNYFHMLQGIIYRNLPEDFATSLHDSTDFKGFNYSRLLGRSFVSSIKNSNEKLITFLNKAAIYISSDDQNLLIMLANILKNRGYITFGHYFAPILSINEFYIQIEDDKIQCRSLTPITVHETIDNRTVYYNPLDSKFFELLNKNYSRKIGSEETNLLKFSSIKNINKEVSIYKNFVIEGYKFEFTLEGKYEDLENVFSLGLGDRNSQGYGMVEVIK